MSAKGDPELSALWEVAVKLGGQAGPGKPRAAAPPPLLFVTDPDRTPDPAAVARRLPAGAGVIYRHFGRRDAEAVARALAAIAAERGLALLIGGDAALAAAVGAHGVHLPERDVDRAPALRARHPDWRITGAAHGAAALDRAAQAGLDAALLSPVFPSASPSAGPPLGLGRFTELVRAATLPVYALGGVNASTAPQLLDSGAQGIALVAGLLSEAARG